ncbi:BrnT family toxin [Marinivivus vitaminiproducens]|uniref:BrnT family toxin n=1 Tax=Marinivivus vitaminiproducens TaxID=3035935 RepID=UPI00279F2426|nr:BrnT family toxin [Geminicoccaceae bacterium SCSIO 64248]
MRIEFDPAKDVENRRKHGVSLMAAADMDFDTALVREDTRFDYGELRYLAAGMIGDRLHMLAFTMRGQVLRVISLRVANRKERRDYGQGQG